MSSSIPSLIKLPLADEDQTIAIGRLLSTVLTAGEVIYLTGTLGAGKTTLSRGILRGFGHTGAVKSPTFTLVEPYELASGKLYHFDLYRLVDPEELEYIGMDEYFDGQARLLIEWPERGEGFLPAADLGIHLEVEGKSRVVSITPVSVKGQQTCAKLKKSLELHAESDNSGTL